MEGFIALHRKILEWEWYDDMNVCRLFIHCLLKANYTDKEWRGVVVRRGTFISTYDKLSQETGLSVKQVRTALDKLKRTNEMANEGTRQHTVFIIKNYDEYQSEGKQKGKQKTDEGQTEGKQRASTNKDNKENKENKNIYKRRLSDDFELPQEWTDSALKYWKSKSRLDLNPQEQFESFKAHHLAKGTTSTDFKHNWKTWYTNAIQYSKPTMPAKANYSLHGQNYQTGDL